MIAIVDYGVGNLRSVQKAFEYLACETVVTSDPVSIAKADGIVLPGVGAFGDAMVSLRRQGLLQPLKRFAASGRPFLGICLGMQLLFSVSEEHGQHVGLGIIPGHVRRMRGEYKIPHVGWNALKVRQAHPLLQGLGDGDYAYFVHSYYVEPLDPAVVIATTDYFQEVPAAVAQGSVMGMQFHPEKSAHVGLRMLERFADLCTQEVST